MSTTITAGKVISIHYTLRDEDGDVLDSSAGGQPLSFLHGAGNIVPGLERQLTGKQVGDKLAAVVPPDEGYGMPQGPGPQPVPRSAFPSDIEVESGLQFMARGPGGEAIPLWVVEVVDETVLVDANHPLAGVTLHFDVEVVGVRDATDEEKAHGHPHGDGGHHH